jgi:microcystin-dependent protein
MGQQIGVETVTLIQTQMPAHQHTFSGTAAAATTATPAPDAVLGATATGFPIYDGTAASVALSPSEAAILILGLRWIFMGFSCFAVWVSLGGGVRAAVAVA